MKSCGRMKYPSEKYLSLIPSPTHVKSQKDRQRKLALDWKKRERQWVFWHDILHMLTGNHPVPNRVKYRRMKWLTPLPRGWRGEAGPWRKDRKAKRLWRASKKTQQSSHRQSPFSTSTKASICKLEKGALSSEWSLPPLQGLVNH